MCRHLAYLGPPRTLGSILLDPPHSLREQTEKPRHQLPGRTNRDGWGVGWWPEGATAPERYRTATPMAEDAAFPEAATAASAFLAAARAATPGSALEVSGNAPFTDGRWLFSLNGYVTGFRGQVGEALRGEVPEPRRQAFEGDTDTEVLFALVLDALATGSTPGAALAAVVRSVLARTDGRVNLLLGDGARIWATTSGNSLFTLVDAGLAAGGVLVASEPLDDHPSWVQVPDASLVVAHPGEVSISPLAGIEGAA